MADTQPVKVFNPYGEPETLDPSELNHALSIGYRVPSTQEVQDFQDQQKYGEGVGNELKAGAAGFARGATFGISDQALVKSGFAKPETLAGLKKYNPISSTAGELGGVGASLLVPGYGEENALTEGAGALAKGAEAVGSIPNPVQAVAGMGKAVTEAAAPVGGKIAGLVANPETSPIVNRILSKAIPNAAGSAVEGAAYGLGQSVSEQALGDPDLTGEKVLSNIGMSALFAGGLGGLLGAAEGAISKAPSLPKEIPGFEKPASTELGAVGNFESTVRNSDLPIKEKESIIDGLTKLKPDAKEIKEAADYLGVQTLPGQLSDSKAVQRIQDSLLEGAPTMSGLQHQTLAKQGFDKAAGVVEGAIGNGSEFSRYSVGEQLQNSLTEKFEQKYAPVKQLYDEIEKSASEIPISDKSTGGVAREIRKIIDTHSLIKGTPEYNYVQSIADGLEQVDSLAKLKTFRTAAGRASGHETRFVSQLVADALDGMEERAIGRFAEKTQDGTVLDLVAKSKEARAGYRALRQDMAELGSALGKEKFYGPQDFLNYLEKTTPEKFAKRLFAKDNVRFMQSFSEKFPEEMGIVRQYQLNLIRQEASKKGFFDVRSVFKQLGKMEPEIKQVLFTPEQLKAMQMAEKYVQSFPEHFNPSNTDNMGAVRGFFSNGPTGAVLSNARDFAMDKFIKNAVRLDGESGSNVAKLVAIERAAQKTTAKVVRGTSQIFKAGASAGVPVAALSAAKNPEKKQKDFQAIKDNLNETVSNPDKLVDALDQSTQHLYPIAPNTSGGIQNALTRASQFLKSKLPIEPPQKPLSPKFTPSKAEIDKFNRYHSVVEDPTSVLDQVKSATITPEAIETLSAVYPKLYSEMKAAVIDKMSEHVSKGNEIPYRTKLSLSMFLGQDMDNTLSPQVIQANQIAMANMGQEQAKNQPGMGKPTLGGMKNLTKANRLRTDMQATSQREEA